MWRGRNGADRSTGAGTTDESRARRQRSLATTGALAAVLVALSAYTIVGTWQMTSITREHSTALSVDGWFSEARSATALEEAHARHYQVEPSWAVRLRYVAAANDAEEALRQVTTTGTADAAADARRLLDRQAAYRERTDRLLNMVADGNPEWPSFDRLQVTPTYYQLQHDIGTVNRAYHTRAQVQAAALETAQVRMLAGTSVGFGLGFVLVAVIWRVVLGYQRRLAQQADANEHLALHDPLTGLPNRAMFRRRLARALRQLKSTPDGQLALMILDLNGFKAVNDTLGHAAGDQLLAEAGQRLRSSARAGDVVARLGGDEFAVLLPQIADVRQATRVADRIAERLREDFLLDAGPAAVSGSIGVAIGPLHGVSDELIRHADAAMYRAKSNGGGFAVYDPEVDAETPDRMALFGELRALLDAGDPDGQLVMFFQPQIRIEDATVTAVEALARWRHPTRGLLMPGAFLPIAEARALEIPLTYHLIDVAVAQAAAWHHAGAPLVVSVNVSPRCLLDPQFAPRVRAALASSGLPAGLLQLELTETSVMTEPERSREVLRQVREHGVKVSIDDFGTGFSSLAQLKRLPADELKIDRTFVRELADDPEDVVLVRSAVDLAHNLGLSVVAEGVEGLDALALLAELGCDLAQGFALSRPVPADELLAACARAQQEARRVPGGAARLPSLRTAG
ncbi:diguanylate cyclase (GGDEF) domain-containing protein [Micromonospora pattaloongensis]|uniref:Diguanylate cyclase (GGDEF) domain-containing protein n=1 Tax=Micromonospora pattaloongensis TaxID=405436 RepID=A0A1H3SQ79_9ACTN|nr:EAL domain-containing protein [Micromonospora pattaloongensis]SDZ39887.1 diguanylate cyclase (GGDEF) domain-containing protein [Micromonospora pattaloongensis]